MRFFLAWFVVGTHLNGWALGPFAIYGFYLISGFLMTLVLHETYHFKFKPFLLNRVLRLFPMYFIVCALTVISFLTFRNFHSFHLAWSYQEFGINETIGNLLIFPLELYTKNPDMTPNSFRIIPTAWSIAVELICYFILWAFSARSKKIALVTLGLALTYHFAVYDLHWGLRYYPFYAAILPFSLGAYSYFIYKEVTSAYSMNVMLISLVIWIYSLSVNTDLGWYLNIFALFLFMISAINLDKSYSTLKKLGKFLGDLSYPVFLCHWLVAFVLSQYVASDAIFYYSIIPILTLSLFLVSVTNRFIEPYRNNVRIRIKPAN